MCTSLFWAKIHLQITTYSENIINSWLIKLKKEKFPTDARLFSRFKEVSSVHSFTLFSQHLLSESFQRFNNLR